MENISGNASYPKETQGLHGAKSVRGLTVAHSIALTHGHLWASLISPEEALQLGSTEKIAEVVLARDIGGMGGIAAPTVTMEGPIRRIEHTTGTGRTTWTVSDGLGTVWLFASVSRPGGDIAVAVDMASDDRTAGIAVRTNARPRHVVAALDVARSAAIVFGEQSMKKVEAEGRRAEATARANLERALNHHLFRLYGDDMVEATVNDENQVEVLGRHVWAEQYERLLSCFAPLPSDLLTQGIWNDAFEAAVRRLGPYDE